MRRKGTVIRPCAKCGGELRPPRRFSTADKASSDTASGEVGLFTCIVCGDEVSLPARRRNDFRETLPE